MSSWHGLSRCRVGMEGGGDGGEGRGGGGGGGGENGGTEFVSVSGGGRRSSGGARSLLSAFEPGSPCHCDRRARERRSRARRIHDARAIFAESGPQREAVFSADVQRRARKQAQRRRCRAAWASREQWRGAAGSDVHPVAPRGRRSARAGQEALGRLKRTSALLRGGRADPLCIRHTPPYRYKYLGRFSEIFSSNTLCLNVKERFNTKQL